jgi:acetyltransferase
MTRDVWNNFMNPSSAAVIGASPTPGSVGGAVYANLRRELGERLVFAVNPKHTEIFGDVCYPTVESVPVAIDLAVITTPAATVPDIVRECGAVGIRAAIVVSAGFDECGDVGKSLTTELRKAALGAGVRVLGPNCIGLVNTHAGLNATFASAMPLPGSVAFLSQSGALGASILDWSVCEKIGLSAFFSLGSMADIGWVELLDYLCDDPRTKSIVVYMEDIGNAREFLSAAREVAFRKPVIVLKAGRHAEGARAAASHTGAMASNDDVVDAAFERCGILRVKTIAELFYMAEALSKQPRPRGSRVAIVTNAGGPAALAADALADEGGTLADLSPDTMAKLEHLLPSSWSKGNPIDVLGDASPERYCKAVKVAVNDPDVDSVLAVLTPQSMTEPTRIAEAIAALERPSDKPLIASWFGGESMADGTRILQQASIPCFPYPDTAARIAHLMYRHGESLKNLYETPQPFWDERALYSDRVRATELIESARCSGRTLLTEYESKRLLAAYGMPVVDTRLAHTALEAVDHARKIGYPVVLKLLSDVITHKQRAGGVELDLDGDEAVTGAFSRIKDAATALGGPVAFAGVTVQPMVRKLGCELIVGTKVDPQFGPVVMFGAGGSFAEAHADYAVALPPLNSTLAYRLMRKTRIFRSVSKLAERTPALMAELERILIAFGELAVDQTSISEIEVNPLLVSEKGLLALDARAVLAAGGPVDFVPTAIAPYPARYVREWATKLGARVTIRPIRPEDEATLARFHNRLSDATVYHRYFSLMGLDVRVAHERLARLCFIDYNRQMALVAEYTNPQTGLPEIAGVGRLVRLHRTNDAEFALVIADLWQGQCMGTELLRGLIECARDMRIERITGEILPDNEAMQHVCRNLGFDLERDWDDGVIRASLDLRRPVETKAMAFGSS